MWPRPPWFEHYYHCEISKDRQTVILVHLHQMIKENDESYFLI